MMLYNLKDLFIYSIYKQVFISNLFIQFNYKFWAKASFSICNKYFN